MAFNPNDFVLQDLSPVPEGLEKALLEYDSKAKLILVRTTDATNGGFKYQSVFLNATLNENLLNNIPDEYSHPKDRLLFFAIYEDGSFYAMKEKMKYSFKEDKSYFIKYDVDDLTTEDATAIFDVMKSTVFVQMTANENARNKAALQVLEKQEYLDELYNALLGDRDTFLRESDYRVLDDYPETFEGEKVLWTQWRAKLREIVKPSTSFESELDYLVYAEEFKWPVDPLVYHAEYRDSGRYLETDDQFSKQPESVSSPRQLRIKRQQSAIINSQKLRDERGVPVSKQMLEIIERYDLCEGLFDFDINQLTVAE